MLDGRSVCEPIPQQWHYYGDYRSTLWSPLPDIDYTCYGLNRADMMRFDPVAMMAIGTVQEALEHAGFKLEPKDSRGSRLQIANTNPARTGVYFGTGIGGINTTLSTHSYHSMNRIRNSLDSVANNTNQDDDKKLKVAIEHISLARRFNPLAVTLLMSNAVAAAPGVRFGITGPCKTTTVACASGTASVAEGFRAIHDGRVDLAIVGASEYLFDDYGSIFRAYDITAAMTHGIDDPHRANRPFDEDRRGFLFSEGGAAALVLERASSAISRGVQPLAELIAAHESFDGYNMLAMEPSGESMERMIRDTIAAGGIKATDLDYVNAHGTGTEMNDAIETEVLARVVSKDTLINSSKGLIGHTIGASGAIEAAVTALSIRDQRVHPCLNLDNPLRELNFPRQATNARIDYALSQSFAFGGHNACLLMKQLPNNQNS
ncbi:MAG: 3-oxoacyl-[acyl-carrier-protein] synthase 2 [marine bacterium B5-7]|nr:MAG: 3-oxoacyl-[acyl-carrier-protein] synthase 2 [marine bacterium B5-7]